MRITYRFAAGALLVVALCAAVADRPVTMARQQASPTPLGDKPFVVEYYWDLPVVDVDLNK